jgi:Flp pilus assembly protein TadG
MRRRNFLRRFWSDNRGNIAVLFTLSIIPVIGAVGAAVDYSMASAYRADLQKSLDATALALSKILPADQETLDTVGRQYFDANMGPNDLADIQVTVAAATGTLTVTATANYQPRLATIFGIGQFPIGATAEARWGIGKVEVALVLDNSLSMNDSVGGTTKIQALKNAAHDLLTILQDAAQDEGDAKVAIIPFDGNIRVIPTASVNNTWINANLDWIRWTEWEANNGNCNSDDEHDSKSSCEADFTCTKSKYSSSKKNCTNNGGSWVQATWTPNAKTNWTGFLQERDKSPSEVNYDVNDTAPTSNETKYPAWQCYSNSLRSLMPLSTSWGAATDTGTATLHGMVNSLTPSGYTNAPIGLVWGLHALSPTPRLTEGAAYDTENLVKIVILLSDGDNTRNRWDSCAIGSTSCPAIDARMTLVCNTLRDQQIKVYTIRLIAGNAALLQACATTPSMYYEVTNAGQLSAVFNAIGAEIANLHLAK